MKHTLAHGKNKQRARLNMHVRTFYISTHINAEKNSPSHTVSFHDVSEHVYKHSSTYETH